MVLFRELAELAEKMAGEASRLKKRAAIAQAIAAVEEKAQGGEDVGRFCLYLAGLPFAEADPRKLNVGGALLGKAIKAVTGAQDAAITAAYRRHGDMGAGIFDLLDERGQEPDERQRALTLADVSEAFAAMATAKTTAMRAARVEGMLRRASPIEAKYLVKLMLGDMRIGVKQSLVEEAIAEAAGAEVAQVRHAVMLEADLGDVARRAFDGTLAEAKMRLFHPLGFMLASPVDSPQDAVERFTAKPEKRAGGKGKVKNKGEIRGSLHSATDDDTVRRSGRDDVFLKENGREGMGARGDDLGPEGTEGGGEERVDAFLEDKYDGMRAQVHCGDPEQPGRVAIYSRNREDITESFPELVDAFARAAETNAGAVILDGEILGWDFGLGEEDRATPRALPFAVLGQRIGRKRVTDEWRERVPVVFMAFDVLYAQGGLTLELPLRERRNLLEKIAEDLTGVTVAPLVAKKGDKAQGEMFGNADEGASEAAELPRLLVSPSRLVESAEDIDRAYADARARSNEGVMLKAAGSSYQPGRRGIAWVKLKRELATLDVVVTGAEFGHGRRAGILSDYTFAVQSRGELLNVGKAYSGLTDAEIQEMSAWMMEHTLEDYGHFRTVEPLRVLEVAFNNIMRSERHSSGFALRFPRILRIREDKPVSEIDTVERVEEVYQSQVDKPVEA